MPLLLMCVAFASTTGSTTASCYMQRYLWLSTQYSVYRDACEQEQKETAEVCPPYLETNLL